MTLAAFVLISILGGDVRDSLPAPGPPRMEPFIRDDADVSGLVGSAETQTDDSEVLDHLAWLREHPYDLNRVTRDELCSLPGVTDLEADAVVEFRESIRKFTSVGQLAELNGIGGQILAKLEPYVFVPEAKSPPGQIRVDVRSRAVGDLRPRTSGSETFLGSPLKAYGRVTVSAGELLQAGMVVEKDPGERVSDGFGSGYVMTQGTGVLSRVILGDYIVEEGQGLVFWRASSLAFGGGESLSAKKTGLGPQPYRFTDEFNFLRGCAVTITARPSVGTLDLSLLLSHRSLAAATDDRGYVTSFSKDGLFRNGSELAKRGSVHERLVGGRLCLSARRDVQVGVTYASSDFDVPVVSDRSYEFSGTSSRIAGVDASGKLGRARLFGAFARSSDGSHAAIAGTVLALPAESYITALYHDYAPGFHNLHACGFGENGDTRNERGLHVSYEVEVSRGITLRGALDRTVSPWRTYRDPMPRGGGGLSVGGDAEVGAGMRISIRYAEKGTEITMTGSDPYNREIRPAGDRSRRSLRLGVSADLHPRFFAGGNVESVQIHYAPSGRRETGIVLSHEIRYIPSRDLSVEGRLAFFDAESYDARLYLHERDLYGSMTSTVLYGRGWRWYLRACRRIGGTVCLSAKYSAMEKEGPAPDADESGPAARIAIQCDLHL